MHGATLGLKPFQLVLGLLLNVKHCVFSCETATLLAGMWRLQDFTRVGLLLALLHAVLELEQLLEEDLVLEGLIDEKLSFLLLYHEEDHL